VAVPGGVLDLRYSTDSRLLAVSSDEQLGIWDLAAGAWQWPAIPTGSGKRALALSPDGRRLVAANVVDRNPRAWDVQTGEVVPQRLPFGEIEEMSFSRDGRFLALARNTPQAEIWDGAGRRLLNKVGGHTNKVLSVAFGPNHLLASAGEDRTVRLWRIHSEDFAEERCVFRGHTAGVTCLAFDRDGTRLASGGEDGSVRVWDTTRDPRGLCLYFSRQPGRFGEFLGNLAFTAADNPQVVVVGEDGDGFHLRSYEVATGRTAADHKLARLQSLTHPQRDFVFSADGRRLATLARADPKAVHVWDGRTGAAITTVATRRAHVTALALSADGVRLAYTDSGGDTGAAREEPAAELTVADATSGRELWRVPVTNILPASLAFSPDGRRLAAAARLGSVGPGVTREIAVEVYDSADGRKWRRVQGENEAGDWETPFAPDDRPSLAFSPDGRRLALAGPSDALRVWDLTSGHEYPFSPLRGSSGLTGVPFSPDSQGRRLAATGYNGQVTLWDAAAGHELLTLLGLGTLNNGHYTFTARVVFSPDGRYLAANDWNGSVSVWDAGPPR
jgi:WD40 repeat protein